MPHLLERLENNEAVLLMYLAGELPAEDQAEVEQMLTTDVQLAAELVRLRATIIDHEAMLRGADAQSRLPVAESVAVRNTLRRMRQWRLEHPKQPAAPMVKPGLAYPWWAYPTSAAAMLLLAMLVWWGFRVEPSDRLVMRSDPFVAAPHQVGAVEPIADAQPGTFAYADPLDQAYLELRSIEELAEGL